MRKSVIMAAGAIVLMGGTALAQQQTNQPGAAQTGKPEISAAVNLPAAQPPEDVYAEFGALIGATVTDGTGGDLGQLADIVFDDAGNKLFVVDIGGDAASEQLVALPFASGEIDAAAHVVTVSGETQADLQALPAFEYADSMVSVRTKTEGETPAQ